MIFLITVHKSRMKVLNLEVQLAKSLKGLIGNFKSDINPNIEKLQSHIENLQNRGEDISNNLSNDK